MSTWRPEKKVAILICMARFVAVVCCSLWPMLVSSILLNYKLCIAFIDDWSALYLHNSVKVTCIFRDNDVVMKISCLVFENAYNDTTCLIHFNFFCICLLWSPQTTTSGEVFRRVKWTYIVNAAACWHDCVEPQRLQAIWAVSVLMINTVVQSS